MPCVWLLLAALPGSERESIGRCLGASCLPDDGANGTNPPLSVQLSL